MTITLDDLEFENGRLVKVRGMRPEYATGGQLIDMVRDLALLVDVVALASVPITSEQKLVADIKDLAASVGMKFTPHKRPADDKPPLTFKRDDHVRKTSGSWWEGRVVGFYATADNPDGVAVQLDKPNGPVQIYPAKALEHSPEPVDELALEREEVAAQARRYASNYPEASDGRKTFIIFADWVEARGTKVTR